MRPYKADRTATQVYRSRIRWQAENRDLVKQVRTPPVRPADGVVGCVYESFVPGVWHRWMEKEILWFCFRRVEPERMISGWTASSRDSSKTEEGAPRGLRTNSLRTPNEFEAQVVPDVALVGLKSARRTLSPSA